MIKTFADRHTQGLYTTGKSRRLPADVVKRARRKLEYIDLAARLDDLKVPPGNRLHALERERATNDRCQGLVEKTIGGLEKATLKSAPRGSG
jgi:plasmid maintenance system killer protein